MVTEDRRIGVLVFKERFQSKVSVFVYEKTGPCDSMYKGSQNRSTMLQLNNVVMIMHMYASEFIVGEN